MAWTLRPCYFCIAMARPAVFFDRDNTLIINDGYLGDPARVILMPGAAPAIARARQLGYAVVTVSNQSGVARGLFDQDAVRAVDQRMDELLQLDDPDAIIDLHIYCPFHPQAVVAEYRRDSDLRKPAPGMLVLAAKKLDLDLNKSWLIGDAIRDIEAGQAAGCRTILFQPPDVPASPDAAVRPSATADFTATSLGQAIEFLAPLGYRASIPTK
jgi:D-glycero-D-manno-heptose 1,7-bisphosphate phosphatase